MKFWNWYGLKRFSLEGSTLIDTTGTACPSHWSVLICVCMRESLVLAMCTGAVHLPSRCHAGICHLWRHTDHCSRPPLEDKEVRQSGRLHGTHHFPVPVQCEGREGEGEGEGGGG